jgi:hypothetical protein
MNQGTPHQTSRGAAVDLGFCTKYLSQKRDLQVMKCSRKLSSISWHVKARKVVL